jgi:CRP-like cAMP-binding protein
VPESVQRYARSLLASEESGVRMLSTIEKVLRLKDVELFVAIPAEDLAEIARVAGEQPVRRGERLLTAGSPGEGLYVLVEGEVDVVGADGRQLARAHPGDVLGEMSLLLDAPCSATCVARSPGRVLRIGRSDFQAFLVGYPEIALGLLRVLADRVREANAKIGGPVSNLVSQPG